MMPSLKVDVPLLYAAPRSGHAYKVALALRLLRLPHEVRLVDLGVPAAERAAEFRNVSRFGEVPVLLIDGLALSQSNAICEYLARRQSSLHERDESQRQQVREWLAWEAGRLGQNLAQACAARWSGDPPAEVARWHEQRAAEDLARLATVLAGRPWVVGDWPTIADVACFAWFPFARELGVLATLPDSVMAWTRRLAALPGFVEPAEALGLPTARGTA